jgi:hypothetical protein
MVDLLGNNTGLKIYGGTLGFEYKPIKNSYVRIEGRTLASDSNQQMFIINSTPSNVRFEGMVNLGVWF